MTILITLTTVGIDCSTFDIYSDVDGFLSAFETDVPKASLLTGFSSANVPDGTTVIRVKAKGVCTNYIDITLPAITTTTTTSSTSTTTTTTTATPGFYQYSVSFHNSVIEACESTNWTDYIKFTSFEPTTGDLIYNVNGTLYDGPFLYIKIFDYGGIIDNTKIFSIIGYLGDEQFC